MNNADVLAANEALARLAQEKLPIGAGIKIRRLARQLTEATGDIDEARKQLLEQYAKRKPPINPDDPKDLGEMVYIDDARTQVAVKPEFAPEWNALMALDADIKVDRPLRVKDLDGIQITPSILFGLGELLDDSDATE